MNSSTERFELFGCESLFVGLVEFMTPFGLSEFFVLVANILHLIGKLIHMSVVNVHAFFIVVDGLIKSSENIFPFPNHILTLWCIHECLLHPFNLLNLWSASESLERRFHVSDWLGVLNCLCDSLNIIPFF